LIQTGTNQHDGQAPKLIDNWPNLLALDLGTRVRESPLYVPLFSGIFRCGFPLISQMKLRMRIEIRQPTEIVNRQTKFSEEVL